MGQSPDASVLKAAISTILTVLLSGSVMLSMTPVYGSVPTMDNARHFWGQWIVTCTILELCIDRLKVRTESFVVLTCCVPLFLRLVLFPMSSQLGPALGAFVTQTTILGPLHVGTLFIATNSASATFHRVKQENSLYSATIFDLFQLNLSGPLIWVWQVLVVQPVAQLLTQRHALQASLKFYLATRFNLVQLLSFAFLLLWRRSLSRLQLFTCVSLVVTSFVMLGFTPSSSLDSISNRKLESVGFRILDSRDSNTGYISVLQNLDSHFRVLRNDHSLLGGVWLPTAESGFVKLESVYPVFNMLEAVRLIEAESDQGFELNQKKSALVVGLGIGTAPSALSLHGINTTVVELDPTVIEFAKKYFELPDNITNINEDAIDFVRKARQRDLKFDYIVHDVFTGGVEPTHLFALEFLEDLHQLLQPWGSIAINYAGDLRKDSTIAVLETICSVYGKCRAFRDSNINSDKDTRDIVNMVVFAHASSRQWHFRQATEVDFLQSQVRRDVLPPRMEIDYIVGSGNKGGEMISQKNLREISQSQFQASCDHWEIMRRAIPAAVWELY